MLLLRILLLIILTTAAACTSSARPRKRSADTVALTVIVEQAQDSEVELSPEVCQTMLAEELSARSRWNFVPRKQAPTAANLKVYFRDASIRLVSRDSTLSRVLSWLFLGPGHFWIHDHTFELRAQPTFLLSLAADKNDGPHQARAISTVQQLNYHEWSGRLSYYLLSNFIPPSLSDPDAETLSESLLGETVAPLAAAIDSNLSEIARPGRSPPFELRPPEPKASETPARKLQSFTVESIIPQIQSPIEILSPQTGLEVKGNSLAFEIQITEPSQLQSLGLGDQTWKAPFERTKIEATLPVESERLDLIVKSKDRPALKIALTLDLTWVTEVERFKITRIDPSIESPIKILAPMPGDVVTGRSLELELSIIRADQIQALQLGDEILKPPFASDTIKARLAVRDGKATVVLELSNDLDPLTILFSLEKLEAPRRADSHD